MPDGVDGHTGDSQNPDSSSQKQGQLRPVLEAPLANLLRHVAEAATGRARIPVQLDIEDEADAELPADVRLALYRIAQEALNNVSKHSGATRVTVRAGRRDTGDGEPPRLELEVSDNGSGMTPRRAGGNGRYGLVGMRERVEALKGTLDIRSEGGRGVRVKATLQLGDELDEKGLPWLLA